MVFNNDGKALKYLEGRGIIPSRGGILYFAGDWGRVPDLTENEAAAVDYLCDEWDYGWEGMNWRPE